MSLSNIYVFLIYIYCLLYNLHLNLVPFSMKDTFNYPKTLRNYDEQPVKQNTLITPQHHTKRDKSLSASYHPKKIML